MEGGFERNAAEGAAMKSEWDDLYETPSERARRVALHKACSAVVALCAGASCVWWIVSPFLAMF